MTHLILVRHGETDWNIEGRWQGQSDIALNSTGVEQAFQLAHSCNCDHLKTIYSSDLKRARQTAQVFADFYGLSVNLDTRLREINQGVWEGLLFTEIQDRFSNQLKLFLNQPWSRSAPEGENLQQVEDRLLEAIKSISHRHPNDKVMIVSHGLAIAIILIAYKSYPREKIWELVPDNCSIEEIDVTG